MDFWRPAAWTPGGYGWAVLGVLSLGCALYAGSPYFAATGLALLGFAPLLARLRDYHLAWRLTAATLLFGLVLLATGLLAGSMGSSFVSFHRGLHAALSWPFDYSSEYSYAAARLVFTGGLLMYGALYATILLTWIVLSLLLHRFRESAPYLGPLLFPVKGRWFVAYLLTVGFVGLSYAVGPAYRTLPFETRKQLVYVAFNVVTVWLVVWHGWLIWRESERRIKAAVFGLLNLEAFFEFSFLTGLILTHGMF